jgi:UDP-glucose 4-epimerase
MVVAVVDLVTGGAGFIGSHVVDALLGMGREVLVLDDLSGGSTANVPQGAQLVSGSVTDDEFVRSTFEAHRIERVYHLAAYAAEGLSHFIKGYNYRNNLIGSAIVLTAAINHEVEHVVFTSSAAVYGDAPVGVTEAATPLPEDSYGIAKWAVEQELAVSERMFGTSFTIFRPYNVFGSRQNMADRYRNVIGIFMRQVLSGEPLTVFGSGDQTRAFSHISNVAPLIAAAPAVPEASNQTFNVGGTEVCSVNDLARMVCAALDAPDHPIVHLDERAEVEHVVPDPAKAIAVFGARPGLSMSEGLTEMASWARTVGPQMPSRFEGIEILRGLPPSWRP